MKPAVRTITVKSTRYLDAWLTKQLTLEDCVKLLEYLDNLEVAHDNLTNQFYQAREKLLESRAEIKRLRSDTVVQKIVRLRAENRRLTELLNQAEDKLQQYDRMELHENWNRDGVEPDEQSEFYELIDDVLSAHL